MCSLENASKKPPKHVAEVGFVMEKRRKKKRAKYDSTAGSCEAANAKNAFELGPSCGFALRNTSIRRRRGLTNEEERDLSFFFLSPQRTSLPENTD